MANIVDNETIKHTFHAYRKGHMAQANTISQDIITKLTSLLNDPGMITLDAYSPDIDNYPSGRISFVEQHIRYLRTHKNVNPDHYISNLELMIKKY